MAGCCGGELIAGTKYTHVFMYWAYWLCMRFWVNLIGCILMIGQLHVSIISKFKFE